MTVNIEYETEKKLDFDYEQVINSVVETACDYVKCPYESEVSVTLTDNDTIQEINKEFRQIDNPTDVLSFPLLDYDIPGDFSFLDNNDDSEVIISEYFNPDSGELVLGDIIISLDKVVEQAEKYGHSSRRELAFLVAHSMMHLFGYDHMESTEAEVMEKKQEDVLQILGITR